MGSTIVIGGGAAGMLAAYAAAQRGEDVLLLEKNEKLGKKMYITGKGRCNLTNAAERDSVFANILTNPRFFYSAYAAFSNEDLMALVEEYGTPLKIERGSRVFPKSDKSSDVLKALSKALHAAGVRVRLNCPVKKILVSDGRVTGVLAGGLQLPADRVIVCTGGLSYPSTGSTGDGYQFAQAVGHTVTPLKPSLVPLLCSDSFLPRLAGLSLRNVALYTQSFRDQGEMLFMPTGISGPLVLTLSAQPEDIKQVWIDFKPALDEAALDARLQKDFVERQNKQLKNGFDGLLPSKMIPVFVECTGIPPELPLNQLTKIQRKAIGRLFKAFPLSVTGRADIKQAVITKGGIAVKEINPKTMESKRVQGLYFAGEVLDLDALTGGYNLQIACSTGYLAGISGKKE